MTYRQIEASREIRLWLGQVIIPASLGIAAIMSNEDLRTKIGETFEKAKSSLTDRFGKKVSKA